MGNLLQKSQIFVKRNSSTILTCVGALGVVATSVMAAKATPKAILLVEEAEDKKGEELTKFEKVCAATPAYIPSIVMGATTIACIFGANVLNKRHQAALTSAYALLDSSYKEYKSKVIELYGDEADIRVKEELVKDHYEETEVEDGKVLFYDEFSQRYFESTTEDVLRAEYELNRMVAGGGAYLNDWYHLVGLEMTDYGDFMGWSSCELFEMQWEAWVNFAHHKMVMDDGLECTIISMLSEPTWDFEEYI